MGISESIEESIRGPLVEGHDRRGIGREGKIDLRRRIMMPAQRDVGNYVAIVGDGCRRGVPGSGDGHRQTILLFGFPNVSRKECGAQAIIVVAFVCRASERVRQVQVKITLVGMQGVRGRTIIGKSHARPGSPAERCVLKIGGKGRQCRTRYSGREDIAPVEDTVLNTERVRGLDSVRRQ